MLHYAKKLGVIVTLLALVSCKHFYTGDGIIQNRSTDYLKARSIPPLKIPPGMSSSTIHEEYPVSSQEYPGQRNEISLIPPGL